MKKVKRKCYPQCHPDAKSPQIWQCSSSLKWLDKRSGEFVIVVARCLLFWIIIGWWWLNGCRYWKQCSLKWLDEDCVFLTVDIGIWEESEDKLIQFCSSILWMYKRRERAYFIADMTGLKSAIKQ